MYRTESVGQRWTTLNNDVTHFVLDHTIAAAAAVAAGGGGGGGGASFYTDHHLPGYCPPRQWFSLFPIVLAQRTFPNFATAGDRRMVRDHRPDVWLFVPKQTTVELVPERKRRSITYREEKKRQY